MKCEACDKANCEGLVVLVREVFPVQVLCDCDCHEGSVEHGHDKILVKPLRETE